MNSSVTFSVTASKAGQGSSPSDRRQCFNCHQLAHVIANCAVWKGNNSQKSNRQTTSTVNLINTEASSSEWELDSVFQLFFNGLWINRKKDYNIMWYRGSAGVVARWSSAIVVRCLLSVLCGNTRHRDVISENPFIWGMFGPGIGKRHCASWCVWDQLPVKGISMILGSDFGGRKSVTSPWS